MKSWSFSRREVFEKCGWRAKLQYVDRLPVPPSPHADRGTAIHEGAQDWVQRKRPDLIPEVANFADELGRLRELYDEGKVLIEDEWGFDADMQPCAWDAQECWLRMKLDFLVHLSPTHKLVIDLKSGKKDGNQIKHADQGQLYTVGTMLKYPETEQVDVEFWYVDKNDSTPASYTAAQAAKFMPIQVERGREATSGVYTPRSNIFSCKWCPYRPEHLGGDGKCEHATGVQAPAKKPKNSNPLFFDFGR